jgi:phage terminase small subunit
MRTEKQETFIEQYCLTGNAAASAELAGYSSPKQRGYELKNKFASDIEERQKKMLQDCVPAALAQLQTLVVSAESESVKLGAIKDVLDRAGMKPAERIQQEISHVEQSSTDELRRELEALMGTSDVTKITGLIN